MQNRLVKNKQLKTAPAEPLFNTGHFALQNAPFWLAKQAVSPSETGRFTTQNGASLQHVVYQPVTKQGQNAASYVKNVNANGAKTPLFSALPYDATHPFGHLVNALLASHYAPIAVHQQRKRHGCHAV